tara:strand:+ start:676 stop:2133 length:1458 start_codon:yes stop_codon:yes gene_type:complete
MPSDPAADRQIMMAPGVTLQDVDSNAQNYQDFMSSQLLGGMTQADLAADMPPMQRRNPMEMPEGEHGPMQIPKPPMGPMGPPFEGPYDPNAPNTPNAPTNQIPRPPVRNPLDTDIEYEKPKPTQIPSPDQRGPQGDPFDQDTRGRDGQFPTMEQQLDNSMQGMFGQQMGGGLQNLSAQAQGASSSQTREANSRTDGTYGGPVPRMHGSIAAPQGGGDWNTAGNKQKGGDWQRQDNQGQQSRDEMLRERNRQLREPDYSDEELRRGKAVSANFDYAERRGLLPEQQSRMQQGPDRQAELPMAGQEGYGEMIRQRRAEQGGPKTLADLRNQAQGKRGLPNQVKGGGVVDGVTYGKSGAPQMTPAEVRQRQISSYNQSRQPTEAEKTFMMAQGNRRNPGSMDMSLLRKPQVTRKPTASTTVNLRTPNQGMQQRQFTDRQNRALGNTINTTPQKAQLMQNAAARYRRAGLRATANRAKPRTSLPQLYGN